MLFLTPYEKVYVYGVLDTPAQDAIVASIREFQTQHPGKILVEFIARGKLGIVVRSGYREKRRPAWPGNTPAEPVD